jgi:MarR family transcriptional regulator, organic hydroperoxide resistance regulator
MAVPRTAASTATFTAGSARPSLSFAGLDQLLGYRLRRAQGAVHRDYLLTLGGLKLTQKQTAVMWLVIDNPGVAQGAIGNALGMDRATMMVLVNRLEARGLLQRRKSSVDARQRELQPTPEGLRLMAQVRRRIARHEARVKRLFSATELRTLTRLLQRLQALEGASTEPAG